MRIPIELTGRVDGSTGTNACLDFIQATLDEPAPEGVADSLFTALKTTFSLKGEVSVTKDGVGIFFPENLPTGLRGPPDPRQLTFAF